MFNLDMSIQENSSAFQVDLLVVQYQDRWKLSVLIQEQLEANGNQSKEFLFIRAIYCKKKLNTMNSNLFSKTFILCHQIPISFKYIFDFNQSCFIKKSQISTASTHHRNFLDHILDLVFFFEKAKLHMSK